MKKNELLVKWLGGYLKEDYLRDIEDDYTTDLWIADIENDICEKGVATFEIKKRYTKDGNPKTICFDVTDQEYFDVLGIKVNLRDY